VDDITIATGEGAAGTGVEGHCAMLQMVFGRLREAGLTLKPSKSNLLHKDLEVLGYRITPDGIKPHEAKIDALRAMPDRLNSPKEVLRFMGMINFNRRFIFMLSDLAAPLYALQYSSRTTPARGTRDGLKNVDMPTLDSNTRWCRTV
jgi:hypothetical protein